MNTPNIPTCITEYTGDLSGKKVIVRAELNAPVSDGMIEDDFRIQKFLPTLQYLQEKGAITIVLAHMGRDPEDTLEPVAEYLSDHVHTMMFYKDFFHSYGTDEFVKNTNTLQEDLSHATPGDVFLLDNIRQTGAEKKNDSKLSEILVNLADLYVHEAFPAAHRKHMSTYGIPTLFSRETKFSGITFHREHQMLSKALKPTSPSLFILGGAKFDTKLPLIESFLPIYDHIMIGGALANNIFQLAGFNVGQSLVEDVTPEQEESLKKVLANDKFLLPNRVTCETVSGETIEKDISEVLDTDTIYDISTEYINSISEHVTNAKSILWNGPLGYYEGGFDAGTKRLAELVGQSDSFSIAGGGDTVDAVYKTTQETHFDHLSSAGGAMIDYLSDGELPGVNILLQDLK